MSVEEKFQEYKLVPDVLQVAPTEKAEVKFPSGQKCELGNELTPTEAKDLPEVIWKADPKAFYTLAMTDPDAPHPDNPYRREWKHWLVCNIPGCSVGKGEPLAQFIPSGPPKGGPHRYTFIVYKQPEKIEDFGVEPIGWTVDGRAGWRTQQFADRYSFGDPVAGNFYLAHWDEYVPVLDRELDTPF